MKNKLFLVGSLLTVGQIFFASDDTNPYLLNNFSDSEHSQIVGSTSSSSGVCSSSSSVQSGGDAVLELSYHRGSFNPFDSLEATEGEEPLRFKITAELQEALAAYDAGRWQTNEDLFSDKMNNLRSKIFAHLIGEDVVTISDNNVSSSIVSKSECSSFDEEFDISPEVTCEIGRMLLREKNKVTFSGARRRCPNVEKTVGLMMNSIDGSCEIPLNDVNVALSEGKTSYKTKNFKGRVSPTFKATMAGLILQNTQENNIMDAQTKSDITTLTDASLQELKVSLSGFRATCTNSKAKKALESDCSEVIQEIANRQKLRAFQRNGAFGDAAPGSEKKA